MIRWLVGRRGLIIRFGNGERRKFGGKPFSLTAHLLVVFDHSPDGWSVASLIGLGRIGADTHGETVVAVKKRRRGLEVQARVESGRYG